uniref:Uncharacterized protein n=1 Tax=Tanacetum cinerariifolium TaxID=118510 RepID=A0A6L2NWP5_TANCI|nr:hypothetical protein [Tanacetum cinerariifolium]
MPKTSKGLTDCLPDNERITSRWHVCKPVRVFYDDGSDEDYGMRPTCNPDLSFCSGYEVVYGKGEHGMLKQWHRRSTSTTTVAAAAATEHHHIAVAAAPPKSTGVEKKPDKEVKKKLEWYVLDNSLEIDKYRTECRIAMSEND